MAFNVVIAGGGVAGIEAALALRALAPELVSVELVSPEPEFAYRPLAVSEPFGHGLAHMLDLRAIAADTGAELRIAGLAGVDDEGSRALLDDGTSVGYDALVIACGTNLVASIPGALTFAGTRDVDAYRHLLEEIDAGDVASVAFAVPHGVVWPLPLYELALMTARRPAKHRAALTLVTPEERPARRSGAGRGQGGRRALRGARHRASHGRAADRRAERAAHARARGRGQGRPLRRPARAARHRDRGRPARPGRVHPGRRARTRRGHDERVRRRRHHELLGEAGRHRRPAGRRRGRGDRRSGGRRDPARALPAGAAKRAPDRRTARATSRAGCARAARSRPWRRPSRSGRRPTRSPLRSWRPTWPGGSTARCDSAQPAPATRRSLRTSGSGRARGAP